MIEDIKDQHILKTKAQRLISSVLILQLNKVFDLIGQFKNEIYSYKFIFKNLSFKLILLSYDLIV